MPLSDYPPRYHKLLTLLAEGVPKQDKELIQVCKFSSHVCLRAYVSSIRRIIEANGKKLAIITIYNDESTYYKLVRISKASIRDI